MPNQYRKCKTCNLTWYEHVDHSHTTHCPFGDCGKFAEQDE